MSFAKDRERVLEVRDACAQMPRSYWFGWLYEESAKGGGVSRHFDAEFATQTITKHSIINCEITESYILPLEYRRNISVSVIFKVEFSPFRVLYLPLLRYKIGVMYLNPDETA